MLTVWGRRDSFNLQKVMWLVDELELPHEHIMAGGRFGGLADPEYLEMTPHGRVPVIKDGAENPDELPIFQVWGELKSRGWFTGLITEPRGIHLMLSPSHAEVADQYLAALEEAVKKVRDGGGEAGPTKATYA